MVLQQLKKEYATYKQQQGDVTAREQRRQFTIMNNMDDIQKMIDTHDQLGSLSAAGEKLQGDLAAVSSITSVIATKEKIKALKYQKYYTGGSIVLMLLVLCAMYFVLK